MAGLNFRGVNMKTIKLGESEVDIKASPVALFYYKQEFKTDLIGDLIKMSEASKDMSNIDTIMILQLIWGMAKAANGTGKNFSGFEKWLADLESVDFTDKTLIDAVIGEAQEGFFRGANKPKPPAKPVDKPGKRPAG